MSVLHDYVGTVLREMAFAAYEPGAANRRYLAQPGDVLSSDGAYIAISDPDLVCRVRNRPRRPDEDPHTDVVAAARKTLLAVGVLAPGSFRLGLLMGTKRTFVSPVYELNLDRLDLSDLGWLHAASTAIYTLMRRHKAARVQAELPQLVADLVPLSVFGSVEWRDLIVHHITHWSESSFVCHDWLVPVAAPGPIQTLVRRHMHRGTPMPDCVRPAPPRPLIPHVSPVVRSDYQPDLFTAAAADPVDPVAVPEATSGRTLSPEEQEIFRQQISTAYTDEELRQLLPADDVWHTLLRGVSDTSDATPPAEVAVEIDATAPAQEALLDTPTPTDTPRATSTDDAAAEKALLTALCRDYWTAVRDRLGRDLYAESTAVKARQHKALRDVLRWLMGGGTAASDAVALLVDVVAEAQLPGGQQSLGMWVPTQGWVQTHLVRQQPRSRAVSQVEQERRDAERGSTPIPDMTPDDVVIPRWARGLDEPDGDDVGPQVRVGAR